MPPYEGALWTPGWWGFNDGHYFFFAGYWGPYIGYYGGINYGFGYIGRGYEGGYWRGGRFQYNNSFNVIRIHTANVYTHPVAAPFARVSFNGPGGAHLRPSVQSSTPCASRIASHPCPPSWKPSTARSRTTRSLPT